MLHWLAGQKPQEGSDPDATGYVEPPETPAPVFAVRAFKHAIFGTPQTVAPKPRRHSNTDNARPRSRTQDARAERPSMTRPKSAGDAHGLGKNDDALIPEPPVSSPTKGILMTPGTATAKRKTVTFGSEVADNEEKKPIKTGLPDDCPGKFPSPFTKAGASDESPEEERAEKPRSRTKLTEALEEARDESARKRSRGHRREKSKDDNDGTTDFADPMAQSGQYWKAQYDSYRENSQREIKKLITKQKAAKSFAKDKDFQCTELTDDLRQEKKKVDKLEKRCADLEAQLQAMQKQLVEATHVDQKPEVVEAKPELAARRSYRNEEPVASSNTQHKATAQTDSVDQASRPEAPAKRSNKVRDFPSTSDSLRQGATRAARQAAYNQMNSDKPTVDATQPVSQPEQLFKPEAEHPKIRTKTRPDSIRAKSKDDIWNQSFGSSSPVLNRSVQEPLKSPNNGRTVTSGTDLTPLKSLSINTLPAAKLARRDSAQPSPPNERFAKEPLVRQEVPRAPAQHNKGQNSPMLSPGLPQPSPEPAQEERQAQHSPTPRKTTAIEATDDLSMPVPASSPFNPSPLLSPPGAEAKSSSYFDRKPLVSTKRGDSPSRIAAKADDASPPAKSKPALTENVKPTAAWNAINAPMAGKRVPSYTSKDGREVSHDRIEAAKARLAAKTGRVLS